MKTNDRIAFVFFESRPIHISQPNCNNHERQESVESENPEDLPKTVNLTIFLQPRHV